MLVGEYRCRFANPKAWILASTTRCLLMIIAQKISTRNGWISACMFVGIVGITIRGEADAFSADERVIACYINGVVRVTKEQRCLVCLITILRSHSTFLSS